MPRKPKNQVNPGLPTKIHIAVAVADTGAYSAVGWSAADGTVRQEQIDSMVDAALETLDSGESFKVYVVEATVEPPSRVTIEADSVREVPVNERT